MSRSSSRPTPTARPDPAVAAQRVAFGTSGHRGSSFSSTFNEAHVLAIAQAICLYRRKEGIDRPAVRRHRHPRPVAARLRQRPRSARGQRRRDDDLARAASTRRRPRCRRPSWCTIAAAQHGLADGVVITPSHNPPEDGGFKYNPPNGGPADTDITSWIEKQANALLADGLTRRAAPADRRGATRRLRARVRFPRDATSPTSAT